MGAKYPVLRPAEIIKALEKSGFVYKSQRGSHVKYVNTDKGKSTKTVIIPMHHEVARGTLRSILEQAGLSLDNFLKYL